MRQSGYWRIVGLQMAFLFAVEITLPVLAPYFSSLGYSDSWISIVFAIFPFVSIFVGVLAADLADHYGRSWLIRSSLILTATAYALYYVGIDWMIIIARVIDAAAFTTITVLLLAKAEDTMDGKKRGKMTGVLMSLQHAVKILGPILGGFLADQFIGYPFFLTIGIYIAMIFILRSSQLHTKRKRFSFTPIKNITWMWNDKELRPFLIMGPAMHATGPIFGIILPLFITIQLGMRYVDVGFAMTALGVTHLLQFAMGDVADRVGHKRMIVGGALLYGLFLLLIGLYVTEYYSLLAMLLVVGTGSAMWNVGSWSFMSEVAQRTGQENRVVGTYMSVAKMGQTISFLVTGAIIVWLGYSGVWIVLGIGALLGTTGAALMWLRSC